MTNRAVFHIHSIRTDAESDQYGTPKWIYNWGCMTYGIYPTLDVCASEANHVCDKYYTKEDDALTKEWDEDFFMNPPYSMVELFMERAWNMHEKYNVNGLILVNDQRGAGWYQTWITKKQKEFGLQRVASDVHTKRIKFRDKDGKIKKHVGKDGIERENTAMYYSAWIRFYKVSDIRKEETISIKTKTD